MFQYLTYPLHPAGYVDHWLLASTYAFWVKNLDEFGGEGFKPAIARHFHEQAPGCDAAPVEGASFTYKGQELVWRAVRCPDDHMIDISAFYHNCHYLAAWAYAILESDHEGPVTLELGSERPGRSVAQRRTRPPAGALPPSGPAEGAIPGTPAARPESHPGALRGSGGA